MFDSQEQILEKNFGGHLNPETKSLCLKTDKYILQNCKKEYFRSAAKLKVT